MWDNENGSFVSHQPKFISKELKMVNLSIDFLSKRIYLTFFLVMIAACSTPVETDTPEIPTTAVQETATSLPPEPTPLPTREPIPEGLIQIPAPSSAVQTAADLSSAEHPPIDRYRLAQELEGLTPAQMTPDVPLNREYQVNERDNFIINRDLSGD
jgi:hypothetical protein